MADIKDTTTKSTKPRGNPNFKKNKDVFPVTDPEKSVAPPGGQTPTDIEVGDDLEPQHDFFHVEKKDPNYHYHWPENSARRIQQMKRDGYEIDPSVSSSEAAKKRDSQKDYLKRQLDNPNISKADAAAAKDMIQQLEATPVDTATNIPEAVLMRTSEENWQKRQQQKQRRLDKMEDHIKENMESIDKTLKREGYGGIQGITDFFKEVVEKNRQR
jgi:hypothetical protein